MAFSWTGIVHGVGIRATSDDRPFIDLLGATYHYFQDPSGGSLGIDVGFSYTVGKARPRLSDSGLAWRLGSDLYSDGSDRLAYLDRRGTFVEFDSSADQWRVRAVHAEPAIQTAARLLRVRPPIHMGNRQIAMRLAVHFPVFWRLAESGFFPLHAAAVSRNGSALLFAGLNGCGKSGLALALCRDHSFKLLADNFVLHNGRQALPFPETLRLAESDIAGLSLRRVSAAPVFGKHHFVPGDDLVSGEAEVAAVFYTVLDSGVDTTRIVELDAGRIEPWIEAQHDFLAELPQHAYTRLLSLESRHPFPLVAARTAQRRLLEGCRTFLLRISTRVPREESANEVLRCF